MKQRAIFGLCLAAAIALGAALIAWGPSWTASPAAAHAAPAAAPAASDANASLTLTILHVNDVHGQTQPHKMGDKVVGGYARLATLVERARSEGDANLMLLFHAGDEFSRGDDLTRRTLGAANIRLMNVLRFDAWTPGNGDYYDGLDNLRKRSREANFAVLAANVSLSQEANGPIRPYVIRQAGPLKVAILGLCTVYSDRPEVAGIKVEAGGLETAAKFVPELRKNADVVVVLSHLGYLADITLARKVAGIDVIVGGHTHTILDKGQKVPGPAGQDVLICQAGEQLEYLGRVEVSMAASPKGGEGSGAASQPARSWRVESARAKLLPLDAGVPEDPAIKALIARMAGPGREPASRRAVPLTTPVLTPAGK
jgi:2',3'-cyclic-nucleotide 2'-phosphodiesterase (5'-nucleotidase family)